MLAAEFVTPEAINFMAKFGRGLVCLTLNEERCEQLNLSMMTSRNGTSYGTNFTVSIEAAEGVTTGISAGDRARTIQTAVARNAKPSDIVQPGHIFPLKAQNGGVLVRAGHTEAAVDIARLAGLNPSGVICEIMKDDGQMARLPDLIKFAKQHKIKVATIADLIEYRRKNEKLVTATEQRKFISKNFGEFNLTIYRSQVDNSEHIALVKGNIDEAAPTLVRMHHLNIFSDCLDDAQSSKNGLLKKALQKISRNENGVIVIIRQPQEPLLTLLNAESAKTNELRNYGTGAQILADLGVKNMTLLTSSKKSVIGLEGYGLKISGYRKI